MVDCPGTWSNGDHLTFLGGYGGQLAGPADQQFSLDTAAAAAATIFGAAGGGFGAFTQPAGEIDTRLMDGLMD